MTAALAHDTAGSTSWHGINGDRGLSGIDRLRWVAYNRLSNAFPYRRLDRRLRFDVFRAPNLERDWERTPADASPARRLSDLFWLALPWERLATALGGSVRAIEIGCGTGKYGTLLETCLGDRLEQYVGVDVARHADWTRLAGNPRFKLIQSSSSETASHLAGANLIVTQSALEHFEEDLKFFRQVAQYVHDTSVPIVQLHLMPSAACLTTFPWHGVRQYTPRKISQMTSLFSDDTTPHLYWLGAARCNRVHRRYITYPRLFGRGDRRREASVAYARELREAIQQDRNERPGGEACFHALMLQSRVSIEIAA
jgi:hypothetical protein